MRRLPALLLALVCTVAVTPALGASPLSAPDPVLDPGLADDLADAAPSDELLVFVHADDVATARDAVLTAGLAPVTTWDRIGVAVGAGTPAEIGAVAALPGVTYVEGNSELAYTTTSSHTATRGEQARETFTDADGAPVDGRGVSVAVIDSGVDGTHPSFAGPDGESRVVRNLKDVCLFLNPGAPYPNSSFNSTCFVDATATNDTDTPSNGGHGTHVASTAGGAVTQTTEGVDVAGAAPGASVIGLSVGQLISVYGGNAGMNWVLEHHADPCGDGSCAPIRVTNHSYGPPGGGAYNPSSATSKLQDALVAEGVVVVWAAGNDGDRGEGNATNPPGQSPTPGVLMVASYDDAGTGTRDGAVSSFSSRGLAGSPATYPDISAPGSDILAACRPALPICSADLGGDPNWGTISGTSMATPHIAGIVAQLLQADSSLTPGDVEQVLEDTAHEFASGSAYEADPRNPGSETSNDKGHGLVDAAAALAAVTGQAEPPLEPSADSCIVGEPQVSDPEGDATQVLVDTPAPSQPSLDIVGGLLASDAERDVTFTVEVAELEAAPSAGSPGGEYFDFEFSYAGSAYYIGLGRSAQGGERYVLGRFGAGRETLAELTGSVDPEANTFSAVLPAGAIAAAVAGAPEVVDGSTFDGLSITSRRDLVLLVPNADTAVGACPFVVGAVAEDPDTGGGDTGGGDTGGGDTGGGDTGGGDTDGGDTDGEPACAGRSGSGRGSNCDPDRGGRGRGGRDRG